jgi:RNA polymerase sigma-70 factor (ECF subfamily)
VTDSGVADEELVAAARRGDRVALDTLLRRHYGRIHAVCRRIAGTTRDADDAAQEAMIRIVRALDRFDGRASFATWTFRIATNTALDELRKRNRRPQLHVLPAEGDDRAEHEHADEHAQRRVEGVADRMAIEGALADLPEEFRVPVVMRDVGDLDYAEIAEALDVPIGTVKSRIARGRRMLVDRLGNRDDPSRRPTQEQPNGGSSEHPAPAPVDPPPTDP